MYEMMKKIAQGYNLFLFDAMYNDNDRSKYIYVCVCVFVEFTTKMKSQRANEWTNERATGLWENRMKDETLL